MIVFVTYWAWLSYRVEMSPIKFYAANPTDVQNVFRQLSDKGSDSSFVIFWLMPEDPHNDEHVELQFSIEGGEIGFDWVLLGETKLKDRNVFETLAASDGYKVVARRANNVDYLRVENGDLVELCRKVMTEMYGATEETYVELITGSVDIDGFKMSTT